MDRYRLRRAGQMTNSRGPDLLRLRGNVHRGLKAALGEPRGGWYTRKAGKGITTEWVGPLTKAQVVERFAAWRHVDLDQFIVGRKRPGATPEARIFVEFEGVPRLALANSSPATETFWSLLKHQFQGIKFAGAYVFKETSPGFWSDHAWGTAVDGTENPPADVQNDETTDWSRRMALSGNVEFDYLLGSRRGEVVKVVAPDFDVEPSGASSSHEWHIHVSVTDHDGSKPPRQGGVF